MSTTSDDMKKGLTFRKFKDGETSQYRKGSEWIFDADHTHKCPEYMLSSPPCQASCPAGEDIRGYLNIVRGIEKPPAGMTWQEYGSMGPVANKAQFEKIQRLLEKGVAEGAQVVIGSPGRPANLPHGYFVKPTIFANVNNRMTIAREEIFGPVLVMIPYQTEEEAIRIANDTVYGLSGYVYSGDIERARRVARKLRTGMVHLNGAPTDVNAPFGGYKQSGNGREWDREGLREFLETKAVMGYSSAA